MSPFRVLKPARCVTDCCGAHIGEHHDHCPVEGFDARRERAIARYDTLIAQVNACDDDRADTAAGGWTA